MWSVDLQRVLPVSRTSKTSSSPQPVDQHEHCWFSPYCEVRAILAFMIHMAGISALKPVSPVIGMENSIRKILWSPPNPSPLHRRIRWRPLRAAALFSLTTRGRCPARECERSVSSLGSPKRHRILAPRPHHMGPQVDKRRLALL